MKRLARLAFRLFFGLAARLRWYWPFVRVLTRVIEERRADGVAPAPDAYTLLALTPEDFRGDLDALAASGRLRILQVPSHWQTRLMYLYYPVGLEARFYLNPQPGTREADCKRRLQRFHRGLLPRLYARLGVDCVIGCHIKRPADVDWAIASKEVGVPYVVLYREGLFASSPELRSIMKWRLRQWGSFKATHLVVHNDIDRDFCIDIGYVEPERVSSLGCLRMDAFIRRVESHRASCKDGPKRVALFPPSLAENTKMDMSLFPAFKGIHVGLAKLAKERPDVEVIFKPKLKNYPHWRELMDRAFREEGLSDEDIPNLFIRTDLDAQELILDSTVVSGINSTTLLEAAIAGKPVVVPFFREMRQPRYKDGIKFLDALQYLDMADDSEHFVRLVEQRLEDSRVEEAEMAGRAAMFAKYVSNPEGRAVERYVELLERLIEEARERRVGAEAGGSEGISPERVSSHDFNEFGTSCVRKQ